MRYRVTVVTALLALALSSAPAIQADIIGEGVAAFRCNDERSLKLPKKINLIQNIRGDQMEGFEFIGVSVVSEYDDEELVNVSKGKIIATAFQIKPDGSETMLAKVTAKMRRGSAEGLKVFPGSIERGDQIRWSVKLKNLPALTEDLGCWDVQLILAVADAIPETN